MAASGVGMLYDWELLGCGPACRLGGNRMSEAPISRLGGRAKMALMGIGDGGNPMDENGPLGPILLLRLGWGGEGF